MNYNRIYIFGGTGSGKTTLAKKISKKLNIPTYTTDDFVYKKRWTEKYSEEEKEENLIKTSKKSKWIIEGVHMGDWTIPALKKADIVIFLNIRRLTMLKRFILRKIKRKNKEKSKIKFLIKVIFWLMFYQSRYYKKHKKINNKFITLRNKKEIKKFLQELK